jgi:outer membrane receptor protein involved in Fe transport
MNRPRRLATTLTILAATLLGSVVVAFADEVLEEVSAFDIPDQPLDQALLVFSKQADVQIIMAADTTRDLEAVGIHGSQRNRDALERLLADRGLQYTEHSNRTIAVHQITAAEEGGASDSGNRRTAGATPRAVMMAQAVAEQSQTSRRTETNSDDDEEKRLLEEIIVTGTLIRGVAPESSPTRTFDREDVQISGAATAQDFIRTLPQNFTGGSNPEFSLGLPTDSGSVFNTGGEGALGSSVNLRGLGSGATLVLLNGHRLAPSSGIGDFADISLIPASAIERVEVMTDGASSIYGSDAIAGVVNFVLRDDFDGAEASFRYGTVTEGDHDEYRASLTGGKSWNTGNALVVYEHYKQDSLSGEHRAFAQGAPLPFDLLPAEERHSVLGSGSQEISSKIKFYTDLTYSTRESERNRTNISGTSFRFSPSSRSLSISAGGTWKASDTWYVDLIGTYSDLHSEPESSGDFISMREIDSDIWTLDARTSGDLFSLPGGDVKLAVGVQFRSEGFTNLDVLNDEIERQADRNVYAFFGETFIPIVGSDNAVSGVKRLEVNVSGRVENYSDFGSTANPKVGVLWAPFETLSIRGSYSTSFKSPPLGRVGANDLSASVFSTSFLNAVLGFTPGDPSIADVVAISVSGTANNLDPEISRAFTAGLDFSEQWGRHELLFTTTWFDINFEDRLGQTPCAICTNNSPFDAPNIAFNSPEAFPSGTIIFSPTLDQINEVINGLDGPFVAPFGDEPVDAQIINFVPVVRNLFGTSVRGVDFELAYVYDGSIGTLIFGLDGTYLQHFDQQAAAGLPVVDQVDTLFNPLDLRVRGRGGYLHDGFSANIFLNYADGYKVDHTVGSLPIKSWTTVDLSVFYDTRDKAKNPILHNTTFRLSVLNLLDEDPPVTVNQPSFGTFGYDPTNASPLNRFIAFDLTKRF